MRDGLGRDVVHTTEPHCLRRTDTGKTTDDIVGEVHDDGEIWSNALWDIHKALGRTKANKVILEGTFFYAPDTSFADAARVTVQAARLLYGKAAATRSPRPSRPARFSDPVTRLCAHGYCGRMTVLMPRLRSGGSWGFNSRPSLVAPVAALPALLSPGREAHDLEYGGHP